MKTIVTLLFFLPLFFVKTAFAFDNDRPNNKFGMHLAQPHSQDIQSTAALVNSTGGKWGYITLVLQENDRNRQKWQGIFDSLRELHLIPIIRLATQPQGDNWRRPDKNEALEWASFLNSLNWVVKERYVILFNEPNHATEWGGAVDPQNYGQIALEFTKKLKEKNPDFFIMLAGLDAAAPSSPPNYEDEEVFLRQVFSNGAASNAASAIEQWNNLLSGLSSHSYPADYVGSPDGWGRKSVRTYDWELGILQNLGLKKELSVFITETGWKHDGRLTPQIAANYMESVFQEVWLPDKRVQAVTPFIFNYQGEPFLGFSWRLPGENGFFPQYYQIQAMQKTKGDAEIVEKAEINFNLPKEIVVDSNYHFTLRLKNLGQGIWDKQEGYKVVGWLDDKDSFDYFFSSLKKVRPDNEVYVDFYFETGDVGKREMKISLQKGAQIISSKKWQFEVLPLPRVMIETFLYPKLKTQGEDFELQVFDEHEQLVYKKQKIKVQAGQGIVSDIQNVSFGEKYRLVLLKPYYLPRQHYLVFTKGGTRVRFDTMFPMDFNKDGKWDLADAWALIKKPELVRLLLF